LPYLLLGELFNSSNLRARLDGGSSYPGTEVLFCEINWGTRIVYVVVGFAKVKFKNSYGIGTYAMGYYGENQTIIFSFWYF
jgi:hypothetical protein